MATILENIFNAILDGDQKGVVSGIELAVNSDLDPAAILNEGMIGAMEEVGRRFEAGEYYVPEMLISARAMQAGLGLLRPRLIQSGVKAPGKVVIGTVKGDLHDIGKNLVSMMLEGGGYEIKDLGTDVPAETFMHSIRTGKPDILALSALLTTTMPSMKQTIDAVQSISDPYREAADAGLNVEFPTDNLPLSKKALFANPDDLGSIRFLVNNFGARMTDPLEDIRSIRAQVDDEVPGMGFVEGVL